jgi:hypothetical protein
MLENGQMCQHFGVGALVTGGNLDNIVERHDAAVVWRVEDFDSLILALFVHQRLAGEFHNLRVTLVETLFEAARGHPLAPLPGETKSEGARFRLVTPRWQARERCERRAPARREV